MGYFVCREQFDSFHLKVVIWPSLEGFFPSNQLDENNLSSMVEMYQAKWEQFKPDCLWQLTTFPPN